MSEIKKYLNKNFLMVCEHVLKTALIIQKQKTKKVMYMYLRISSEGIHETYHSLRAAFKFKLL